jgi:hypothetical protein
LGVRNRYVEWGCGLPDLDNDGWPDVFYVTGNVYPEVESHFSGVPPPQPGHRLSRHRGLRLRGRDRAQRLRGHHAALEPGAAFGDFDNDGDIDVLIMNMNAPPALLRNDLTVSRNWIDVALEGVGRTGPRLGQWSP